MQMLNVSATRTITGKTCLTKSALVFNIYFVRELQKLLKNITVNSINPGLCVSELRRNTTGERAKALDEVVNAVAYTSEEGARCLVYALVAEQEKEEALRGQYLSLMEVAETSPFSNSKEGQSVQHNIWVRTPPSFP